MPVRSLHSSALTWPERHTADQSTQRWTRTQLAIMDPT